MQDYNQVQDDRRPLTEDERMILLGLHARDRETMREYVLPLQADFARFKKTVEERVGIPAGALGTTHEIDPDGYVIPVPLSEG